jgi:Holliday junction DNA helicase RuvB
MTIDYSKTGVPARNKQASSAPPPRPGVLTQRETDFDQRLEQTIRPKKLSDYIGQQALKETIDISLQAAKQRNEPLDHTLLYGPPGLGKSTLAMVLSAEMDAEIVLTSAPALERPRDIVGILMALKPGSVLFIDEIHRLNKVTEEILYPAMEDFAMDRTIGKGQSTKVLRVPLPRFTLIGATTKAGSISSPLRDRFGIIYRLNFYTLSELTQIVQRSSRILDIPIDPEGATSIAQRSRGTPRIANRLLRRVRDFVQVRKGSNQSTIDSASASEALDLMEIDNLGLDPTDRRLLQLLIESFGGGPVGIETLATAIGEDARTIEDVYEPYLLQAGLLHRTPRGRVATIQAVQHLGISLPQGHQLMQQGMLNLEVD